MARRSTIEDIMEGAFENPILGIIVSVICGAVAFYFSRKGIGAPATPANIMTRPLNSLFSSVFYMLSAISFLASVFGYIFIKIKGKKQADFYESKHTLEDVKSMSWKDFEYYIGELFRQLGYSVDVTGGPGDGGVDLVVRKNGRTHLVQCKKYRNWKVSLRDVRDFYGAMSANLNINAGYFITTGIFTLEAIKFAEDKNIDLIDGARLIDLIKTADQAGASQKYASPQQNNSSPAPICPKCGSTMVLRTAKKGITKGEKFWGCAAYPNCKFTQGVTDRQ